MAQRWLQIEERLSAQIDALAEEVYRLHHAGETINVGKLYRLDRYKRLLLQAQDEFDKYAEYAETTIVRRQQELRLQALEDSMRTLAATVGVGFDRANIGAVEAMIGLAGDGQPIGELLKLRMVKDVTGLPLPGVRERLTQTLVSAAALGWNPRKTASMIADALTEGLQKALVIARTEQMRVYRQSSLKTYQESGVVEGVQRLVAHNARTCLACLADEGHIYPVETGIPDHPQGRCAGVPVLKGMGQNGYGFERGEEWLKKQDDATQIAIMGKQRWKLWKDGKVDFADFARITKHDVWGDGLRVTRLSELGVKPKIPKEPPVVFSGPRPPEGMSAAEWLTAQAQKAAQQAKQSAEQLADRLRLAVDAKKMTKKMQKQVDDALAAIARVHRVPDRLHDLPVTTMRKKGAHGQYSYYLNGKPYQIQLSTATNNQHVLMTMCHETGHYLDHKGIGGDLKIKFSDDFERFAANNPELLEAYRAYETAVRESRAMTTLRDMSGQSSIKATLNTASGPVEIEIPISRDHVRHLRRSAEVWARAYSQYIATKSGNKIMRDELTGMLAKQNTSVINYHEQWDDDDFVSIMNALDRLFEVLGWTI